MDELELLAAKLNQLTIDPQATMRYDLFAGGVVWSDEWPMWDKLAKEHGLSGFVGLSEFRALLNHRHSLILGNGRERFKDLWERAKLLCPNWPGFLPSRRDPALADEARQRSEASRRSFDELDERWRQQQAKAGAMSV